MITDPRRFTELGDIRTVFFEPGTGWGENADGSPVDFNLLVSPMTGVVSHTCSEDIIIVRIGDDPTADVVSVYLSVRKEDIIDIV